MPSPPGILASYLLASRRSAVATPPDHHGLIERIPKTHRYQVSEPAGVGGITNAVRRDLGTLAGVLTIDRATHDAIVAHARRDHPDEACGVVAGPAGADRPERFIAMTNAERSPTFYRFDAAEQLRVWREMDDRDEEPVIIYHSHTATEAYPSRTDLAYANEPGAHYILVSTRHPDHAEFRSFRIADGVVTEEEVKIVERYLLGHTPAATVYD